MFGEEISPFTHIQAVLRVCGPPRSSHVELHATVASTLDQYSRPSQNVEELDFDGIFTCMLSVMP